MIPYIIGGIGLSFFLLIVLLLYYMEKFIEKSQQAEDEAKAEQSGRIDEEKYAEIASRPDDNADAIIDRMHEDSGSK